MLRALIVDLAAAGVVPVTAQAAAVVERVPGQVERAVLARLGRLDKSAVRLAQALAVLGEGTELRLAAALAGLDIDAAAAAADALLSVELLAEGRPLHFVHPLVRSAVYDELAPGVRAQAHGRAARLLASQGAGPERVAAQVLLCEPTGAPDAVQALREAAAAALDRGAPDIAVTYLRRALAEPPPDALHAALLAELGCAERIRRDPAARVHLEQAWQATTEPVARARLAAQLADVLFFAGELDRYVAVLQAGLADLGDRDPELAVRLSADRALLVLTTAAPPEPPEVTLEQLRGLAAQSNPISRWAQLLLASVFALRGERRQEVAGLIERGWDDGRFVADETCEAKPALIAVLALTCIDELDRAYALTKTMLADAQARGSVMGSMTVTSRRGVIALRRGALAEAEADTSAGFEEVTNRD